MRPFFVRMEEKILENAPIFYFHFISILVIVVSLSFRLR